MYGISWHKIQQARAFNVQQEEYASKVD